MEYTPEKITSLGPNEIFCFGSNRRGVHGAGAARHAVNKFGAIMGQGEGLQGQSYGLSTKDRNINSLSLREIRINIERYLRFAAAHPNLKFYTTKIGCGLAGYNISDIAPLFFQTGLDIPNNVILPEEFWKYQP